MTSIIKLLHEMRDRTALYIGDQSVIKLSAFLRGYSYALEKIGERDGFLPNFRDWIIERFEIRISQSWENVILFHSVNEKEAMTLFWKLFDEFITEVDPKTWSSD